MQTLKCLLKSGQVINFLAKEEDVDFLTGHIKFLSFSDGKNAVWVSIDDILAFEVLKDAPNTEKNESTGIGQPSTTQQP